MQIKFLTLYHNFSNKEKNLADAQRDLLSMWHTAIFNSHVQFIPEAKVEFKDYSFFEYPDQEKAKAEIHRAYGSKSKRFKNSEVQYWWAGEQYPSLDTLYNALAEQKRFMELVITVENL
jgi:glutathione S-transferase